MFLVWLHIFILKVLFPLLPLRLLASWRRLHRVHTPVSCSPWLHGLVLSMCFARGDSGRTIGTKMECDPLVSPARTSLVFTLSVFVLSLQGRFFFRWLKSTGRSRSSLRRWWACGRAAGAAKIGSQSGSRQIAGPFALESRYLIFWFFRRQRTKALNVE